MAGGCGDPGLMFSNDSGAKIETFKVHENTIFGEHTALYRMWETIHHNDETGVYYPLIVAQMRVGESCCPDDPG